MIFLSEKKPYKMVSDPCFLIVGLIMLINYGFLFSFGGIICIYNTYSSVNLYYLY